VTPSKLVLCVIDAMAPAMLQRTVAEGGAPVLEQLMKRGLYVSDCVSAFPSVTPVCAASIVTGAAQDEHLIPGMNWYHRQEGRYVEYGSSFRSAQRFGIARQLTDTVYNMNRAHLAPQPETIFERLDDAGLRTAGTTYLMYRGRHRHEPQREGTLAKIAASTLMRHAVMGPRELFYADIFASRKTPCRSGLGMPGVRDRHSGCVGAYMVENDLFDFMLFSLPDNDWVSHKYGPEAQLRSIAAADQQLARMMEPAGGVDRFLEDHAVIVMADHSQAPMSAAIPVPSTLQGLLVLGPEARLPSDERPWVAFCPSQRAAMFYVLDEEERDALRPAIVRDALAMEGVELAAWLERDAAGKPREGAIRRHGGELRFAAGGQLRDRRGRSWSVEGDLGIIGAEVRDGVIFSESHPDALGRVMASLSCPTSGDVMLSAMEGYEFSDWGGQAHVGGGSHGSLRAEDSLAPLILCGVGEQEREQPWSIKDVTPVIANFFGLQQPNEAPADAEPGRGA
jgi:Type I phosphodiesterase / nucleotide pyrophosphatase